MPTLVDSNVLLDIINNGPTWRDWSVAALTATSKSDQLVINPVIYAEVSAGFKTFSEMQRCIQGMNLLVMPTPEIALFNAGKAFIKYRQRGGSRLSPLPDFFISAHAEVEQWPLISQDKGRYATYFPRVALIAPDTH